jgi:hypothetical protein
VAVRCLPGERAAAPARIRQSADGCPYRNNWESNPATRLAITGAGRSTIASNSSITSRGLIVRASRCAQSASSFCRIRSAYSGCLRCWRKCRSVKSLISAATLWELPAAGASALRRQPAVPGGSWRCAGRSRPAGDRETAVPWRGRRQATTLGTCRVARGRKFESCRPTNTYNSGHNSGVTCVGSWPGGAGSVGQRVLSTQICLSASRSAEGFKCQFTTPSTGLRVHPHVVVPRLKRYLQMVALK